MVHLFGGPGVSFYGWILPLVLITRFFGKRVLLDCGNGVSESGPDEIGRLTQAVLLLCDRVLLASDYQVQQAKSVGLRGVYISGSVDLSLVEPRLIESVQPRIVVAGHLDKISNLRCAIRAFKLVKQKYPRTEMLVIGDGPERARLEVMVAMGKIGGITFTGEVDRDSFRRHLRESDIYLNCCSVDYLPETLLEAAAHGLPVVTTPVGGIRDALEDRRDALIVKAGDHGGLADRLIELVENSELVKQLSQRGETTATRFDWKKISRRWLEFYSRPSAR